MIIPGLCSITFRKLNPSQIITLVLQAGLQAIEWGGDIHVPHGDIKTAREVRDRTLDAGLSVSSYGSYYRAGDDKVSFEDTLKSAVALGAESIRVWAGTKGSEESPLDVFEIVASDLRRCARMAAELGISVTLEFHDDTLTDTTEAALRLLKSVPEVTSIWQPKSSYDEMTRIAGLEKLLSRLGNLHVFHWLNHERFPLSDGLEEWKKYLSLAASAPGNRFALLEFVKDDEPQAFLNDAATLRGMLEA